MNRSTLSAALCLLLIIASLGCSSGGPEPISPGLSADTTSGSPVDGNPAQTYLWGYYEVFIDVENMTAEAVYDRNSMFTGNIVNFLNDIPASLEFDILEVIPETDYIDIDIDVTLMHPFPGMPQFNGYDVRGVFMGDGSAALGYDSGLIHPVPGEDQCVLADPDDPIEGNGAPDGFTRWFNITEFGNPSMPLFGYTQGKLASPGFNGTATLCPYKYFANDLAANEDLWTYLNGHPDLHGEFTTGESNIRNYYLRFPSDKGTVFGYAILANWEGPLPEDHPSNAPEAVGCKVVDNSNVYYVDPVNKGGDLILDISLFGWECQPSTIFIESTVLSSPHQFTSGEMIPIGGGEHFSTYHVDIPADNVTGTEGNEYWVIAQYDDFDYSNDFGVPNLAETDPLAAFFRYDLYVSPEPQNQNPVCDVHVITLMPYKGCAKDIEFDASESYDPEGELLTFEWDFDGDGVFGDPYNSGADDHPFKYYDTEYVGDVCVRVSDPSGGQAECCVSVDITAYPSKNILLREGVEAVDITIDHTNGDLLVLYADKKIYKHHKDDCYQTGTLFISLDIHLPQVMYAIDIAPNQYLGIALTYVTPVTPGLFIYDPNGGFVQYFGQAPPEPIEAYAMTAGSFQNDLGFVRGRIQPPTGYHQTIVLRTTKVGNSYTYGSVHDYIISDGNTFGYDRIYYDYIQGVESDATGDFMWFLEDPDYYASRWELYMVGNIPHLDFDNAYFGTGSQTDDDDGWNNAKDITRDDQNRYFVLDDLSTGEPRVKVWTVSGNTTTSIGSFGDSTTISGTPLRIEGSDYDGDIVVLHGDSPPHMISAFVPSEMPD